MAARGTLTMTPHASTDLVIFDCDGVLIDSESIACRVDAACLTEAGFPTEAHEVRSRYVGIGAAAMFADLEARHGRPLPAGFPDLIHDRLAAAFEAELEAVQGIADVVAALPCRTCVASSSGPERLRHSLGLVGLYERFAPHIFSGTQVARGKPAPDLFLFAAGRMDVPPHRCLVVEDSLAGVEAAVAAGMRVIGFTAGGHCLPGHGARLKEAGAFAVAADSGALSSLLPSR